jgi:hypothetical protein
MIFIDGVEHKLKKPSLQMELDGNWFGDWAG